MITRAWNEVAAGRSGRDSELSLRGKSSTLHRLIGTVLGGGLGVILMAGAIWAWQDGIDWVQYYVSEPELGKWAVRFAALALASAAQAVWLALVLGAFFGQSRATRRIRLAATGVFLVTLSAAVTLGIVSRI